MSKAEVSWAEATWVTSIFLAMVITIVGIAFFTILILTSISLARLKILQKFFWNFIISFVSSFLNLFLLFGAFFAFPAVVLNSIFVTIIYANDLRNGFTSYKGGSSLAFRYLLYLFVSVISTLLGACFMKYTPGILHESGEVPPLDWEKDFGGWEGLGGWLIVNLAFGSLSLLAGCAAETWSFRRDALSFHRSSKAH